MHKRLAKSKPTWAEVRAELAGFDRVSLLGVMQDLYAADECNRAFLHARFGLGEDPLKAYKETIDRWLWPDVFRGQQTSVSRAKEAITRYEKALGDRVVVAELASLLLRMGRWVLSGRRLSRHTLLRCASASVQASAAATGKLPGKGQNGFVARLDRVWSIGRQLGNGVGEDKDVLLSEFELSVHARGVIHGNRKIFS